MGAGVGSSKCQKDLSRPYVVMVLVYYFQHMVFLDCMLNSGVFNNFSEGGFLDFKRGLGGGGGRTPGA